jgi:hypothetical protein
MPSLSGAQATNRSSLTMMDCFASSASTDRSVGSIVGIQEPQSGRHFFFIIFVDRIFTSLLERLFTKVFDVTGANTVFSDLCRARNAD